MCDVLGGVELACPAASAAEANAAIVQSEMIAARRFMLSFLSSSCAGRVCVVFRSRAGGCGLHILHQSQDVATENFLYFLFRISAPEQAFGNPGEPRGVFHAVGHFGAVEIGAQTDVVDPADFDG